MFSMAGLAYVMNYKSLPCLVNKNLFHINNNGKGDSNYEEKSST